VHLSDPKPENQWPIDPETVADQLAPWLESFLLDRKAQNMTTGTLYFYRAKLKLFTAFCERQSIERIAQLTPELIRRYLTELDDAGHNPGGIHAAFRVLRTFLYWWEAEVEPEGWKNPIRRVKAPKVPLDPIEPVELATVQHLVDACQGEGFTATRDRALLLFLLDTGARAAEVCALDRKDVDTIGGAVLIRQGKGRKPRTVFLGQAARRAYRRYLKQRSDRGPAAWVTEGGERLTYWGLNEIIRRRAAAAGVQKPTLHDFRRAFALNFLRNNPGEIYALQKLMGHADLQMLRRYLAQSDQDLKDAHRRGSPVDHNLKH
jgi:site-specific recombinase XerD